MNSTIENMRYSIGKLGNKPRPADIVRIQKELYKGLAKIELLLKESDPN